MHKKLIDAARLLFPLGRKRKADLESLKPLLTKKELADVRYVAKLRRVGFHSEHLATSSSVSADKTYLQLAPAVDDAKIVDFASRINEKIRHAVLTEAFDDFKQDAITRISSLVAPNLLGLDSAKRAAALQLFCEEPVHILLLGDPGTGKTEILRSIERLSPHAVFGLGSGASKAGLVGMHDGKEFLPGLLLLANEGIALIDELNLMKKEDQAGLYSAMEKGFITYDKKAKHERHDAHIRILATANPKGARFYALDQQHLKPQLPFDDALLSRFHLLFIVRRPTPQAFEQIARRIARHDMKELPDGDVQFVQEYVRAAQRLNVGFDAKYEAMIVDFVDRLKAREEELLVEVSPRLVIGIIRMAKGFARARLARHTDANDVENALKLLESSLGIDLDAVKKAPRTRADAERS